MPKSWKLLTEVSILDGLASVP